MSLAFYDEALRKVLVHEGGYINHPSDPGGPTNYGITLAVYRQFVKADATALDVRRMPLSAAKAIYKARYWDKMRCDDLPPGVDYCTFDYGVNSGVGRAPKVLKRVLGLDAGNASVTVETIAAARRRDSKAIINAICDERLRFLKALRTWPTFGVGWSRRVAGVRAGALAMVDRAGQPGPPPAVPAMVEPVPGKGQVPENKVVKEALRTGVPTATAVTGLSFWGWVQANPKTSVLIALVLAALVIFGVVQLRRWREQKQETPMPDTPVVPEGKTP